jgi:hypothetical protein
MKILQLISLLQSLQAVIADLKSSGALDAIAAAMPEIHSLIAQVEAVMAKLNLSKIEGELTQALGRVQDLLK